MAIVDGYISLAEFKAYKEITSTDATDDGVIEELIEGASRFIDRMTGQYFRAGSSGAIKYYTAEDYDILFTDPIITLESLKTDEDADGTHEITWNTGQSTGDFYLMPMNQISTGFTHPYTWIEINPNGDYTFPLNKKGVKVTGKFGWTAPPDEIKNACYEIVAAAYGRRSGQNLTGTAEVTGAGVVITPEDITPYARSIIRAYTRAY